MRLLAVGDDRKLLSFLVRALREDAYAVDTALGAEQALEVARANAARHQLEDRVQFHQRNLLSGLDAESFDFVVSNPPYVGRSEEDEVQLEVRKFEPSQAVFAGETGIEVIARLIPQARSALKVGGWLVMEISGTIVRQVEAALQDWRSVSVVRDLQQIPRVAVARRP